MAGSAGRRRAGRPSRTSRAPTSSQASPSARSESRHGERATQHAVGVNSRGEVDRDRDDERQDPQAWTRGHRCRLDREVDLPEHGRSGPRKKTVGPCRATSGLMTTNGAQRDAPRRRPAQLAPEPGGQRGERPRRRAPRPAPAGARRRAGSRRAPGTRAPPTPARVACNGLRRSARSRRLERERNARPGVDREREVEAQAVLGQRRRGRGDADVVRARDQPGRRELLVARRRDQAGGGAERALGPPSGSISAIRLPAAFGLANTPDTSGPSSSWRATMSWRTSDQRPTRIRSTSPTEDSRFERATLGTPASPQPRLDLVARAVLGAQADELDRQLLAVLARAERLRERADDGRDAHRASPSRGGPTRRGRRGRACARPRPRRTRSR